MNRCRHREKAFFHKLMSASVFRAAGLGKILLLLTLSGCVTEITNPPFEKSDPEQAVKISVKAGMEYLKSRNFERAHHHLSRALEIDPKSPQVNNAIALLYERTGDIDLEEKHYKIAIRSDKEYVIARNNYGAFLYRQQRYEEALRQLEVAASDPSYENRDATFVNMGLCALQLDDYDLAEASFLKAIRLNSSQKIAYLELADIYFDEMRFEDADRFIKRFGSVARHTPRSLWLGIQIARKVDDKDAEASFELALKNIYPQSREYELYLQSEGGG